MNNETDLTIGNTLEDLERLVGDVNDFLERNSVSSKAVYAADVALEEMISNVIKYGHDDKDPHEIHVSVAVRAGHVAIRVVDDGREFDPTLAPEPNTALPLEQRKIGGLGIHLVRNMVEAVSYRRLDGKNVLDMKIST